MENLKVWLLLAAISLLATILGFMIKLVTKEVIKRLDEIVNELKQLSRTSTVQEEQIKRLSDEMMLVNQRLNEHSERIHQNEMAINSSLT
jgi:septal ring factor EnvC (AmiA/AmiB activator)